MKRVDGQHGGLGGRRSLEAGEYSSHRSTTDKIGKRLRSQLGFFTPFPHRPSRRLRTPSRLLNYGGWPGRQTCFAGRSLPDRLPSKDDSERLIVMTSGHPQRMKIAIFLNAIYRHMAIFKVNPPWSPTRSPILSFCSFPIRACPLLRSQLIDMLEGVPGGMPPRPS